MCATFHIISADALTCIRLRRRPIGSHLFKEFLAALRAIGQARAFIPHRGRSAQACGNKPPENRRKVVQISVQRQPVPAILRPLPPHRPATCKSRVRKRGFEAKTRRNWPGNHAGPAGPNPLVTGHGRHPSTQAPSTQTLRLRSLRACLLGLSEVAHGSVELVEGFAVFLVGAVLCLVQLVHGFVDLC